MGTASTWILYALGVVAVAALVAFFVEPLKRALHFPADIRAETSAIRDDIREVKTTIREFLARAGADAVVTRGAAGWVDLAQRVALLESSGKSAKEASADMAATIASTGQAGESLRAKVSELKAEAASLLERVDRLEADIERLERSR